VNVRDITKVEFVERFARLVIDCPSHGLGVAEEARRPGRLDGIYNGKSEKIRRFMRIAYLRGVRRGCELVWEGHQPVGLRSSSGDADA